MRIMIVLNRGNLRANSSGAAAILTVLVFSLMLTVIVVGLLRLSIVDSRSSVDDDLTNRAFFAAESGINEIAELVRLDQVKNKPQAVLKSCQSITSPTPEVQLGDAALDVAITCEIIDPEPARIEALVPRERGFSVPLQFVGGTRPSSVVVSWHIPAAPPAGDGLAPNFRSDELFLSQDDWNAGNGHPSVIRLSVINHPSGSTINLNQVQSRSMFLIPSQVGETIGPNVDGDIISVQCNPDPTAEYACSATVPVPASGVSSLNIEPLYGATHVRVEAGDGSGFQGVQVVADVTARAGDVYRRVQANIDVTGGSSITSGISLPEEALSSGRDICKLVTVPATAADACP